MQQKKIPMRQCAGCREMKPKRELIRIVRSPEGEISLDSRGKKPGRGVYICPSAQCLAKARKAKSVEHSLDVSIPPEIYDALAERIGSNDD